AKQRRSELNQLVAYCEGCLLDRSSAQVGDQTGDYSDIGRKHVRGAHSNRNVVGGNRKCLGDDLAKNRVRAGPGIGNRCQDVRRAIFTNADVDIRRAEIDIARSQSKTSTHIRDFLRVTARLDFASHFSQQALPHDGIHTLAIDQQVAGFEDIEATKLIGIDAEPARDVIHVRLDGEVDLKIAGTAHDAAGDAVGVDA